MYRRHKILSFVLLAITILLTMEFNIHYSRIAEVAITVISIALAVYISVSTALLGSSFSKSLKTLPDREHPEKSMLGVLRVYLKTAEIFSVATIISSSIYILKPDTPFLRGILKGAYPLLLQIVSSCSCFFFVYSICLMCLIMDFLIAALMNAATSSDPSSQ